MLCCCSKSKVAPAATALSRTTSVIKIEEPTSQAKDTKEKNTPPEEAKTPSIAPTPREAEVEKGTPQVAPRSLAAAEPTSDNSMAGNEMLFTGSSASSLRTLSETRGPRAPKISYRTIQKAPTAPASTTSAWVEVLTTEASLPLGSIETAIPFAASATAAAQTITPTHSAGQPAIPTSSLSSGVMGPLSSRSGLPTESPSATTTPPSNKSDSYSLGPKN